MLWKCCTQYPSIFGKLSSEHKTGKCQFSFQSQKRSMPNCKTMLIPHANKVILKILQAKLQQYVNHELPDVQAGFRKGRGTRGQIAKIHWLIERGREFQKNIYFCFIDYAKATTNCGKFSKIWEYQTTWLAFWEICIQVRKQQLELGMEQHTGSK